MKEQPPIPAVSALIVHNNNILLVKTKKCKKYTLPGGRIKKGETILQAIKREIWEETCLKIKNIKLVIIQENIFSDEYKKKEHFISFEYSCGTINKKVVLNKELIDFAWISTNKIFSMTLDSFTKKTLNKYLKSK